MPAVDDRRPTLPPAKRRNVGHGPRDRRRAPAAVAFWRKGDKNFWCRAGSVGRGFAGDGVRGRVVVVRWFGARFQGFAGRGSGGALSRFGSRQPWLRRCLLRKTDVRVARLRVTTVRLPAKPVLEPSETELREPQSGCFLGPAHGAPSSLELDRSAVSAVSGPIFMSPATMSVTRTVASRTPLRVVRRH